jgi:hypothetical protein
MVAPLGRGRLMYFSPVSRSEQMADAGCFGFLVSALLI